MRYRDPAEVQARGPALPTAQLCPPVRRADPPPQSRCKGRGYMHSDPLAVMGHLSLPRHLLLRYGVR